MGANSLRFPLLHREGRRGQMSAFLKSRFDRRKNDDYKTIDERCLSALLSCWHIPPPVWEPCSTEGSAIADQLEGRGIDAVTTADAFGEVPSGVRSIVTNPPYKRGLVDKIIGRLSSEVGGENGITAAAFLVRSQWDHAKSRETILSSPFFACLLRLRFRPWWSEERVATPNHDHQWVIFDTGAKNNTPIVKWSEPLRDRDRI